MRFASLGSGSRGNAMVVEAGATRILVDCGFGPRELARRLARLGLTPEDLDGIVVTHEHSDHVGGIARCAPRHDLEVFMTHGTRAVTGAIAGVRITLFDGHAPFSVDGLEISPFPVPHDAREPAQFLFSDGAHRLGVLTDAGHVTPHMVAMLSACDALVLECNHDAEMLANGDYPGSLKRRIAGPYGHLDNAAAANLLQRVDRTRLRHVVAAHLSESNNTPRLAREALAGALGCEVSWVAAATQDEGFSWRELT